MDDLTSDTTGGAENSLIRLIRDNLTMALTHKLGKFILA